MALPNQKLREIVFIALYSLDKSPQDDTRLISLIMKLLSVTKKATIQGLKEGTIDTVVGTHALFGAEFKKLGLVIIDGKLSPIQHRPTGFRGPGGMASLRVIFSLTSGHIFGSKV